MPHFSALRVFIQVTLLEFCKYQVLSSPEKPRPDLQRGPALGLLTSFLTAFTFLLPHGAVLEEQEWLSLLLPGGALSWG